ncbi:MAG: RHS repeat protein, partial [Chloroflexi bacterium]|nr:RHS repeat protein [Chloroflexota bacterium]
MPPVKNRVSLEAQGAVTPNGAVVASRKGELAISLPAGAIAAPHVLTIRDRAHPTLTRPGGSGVQPLIAFDIELRDDADRIASGRLEQEAIIAVDLNKIWLGNLIPNSLTFFTLNEETNRWEPVASELDYPAKKLVARTRHFSGWSVGGDGYASMVPNVQMAQTSLFTRSADAAVELKMPPGLSGIVPKLVLHYSSNAINRTEGKDTWAYYDVQSSWVGLGWALDLGSVTIRHVDTQHVMYFMSLGGTIDRILQKDGQQSGNRWYLQRENFTRIEHFPDSPTLDYWLATTKDGTKYRFGYVLGEGWDAMGDPTNTGSRQEGVYYWVDGNPRGYKYRWLLDRIEDTNGNVVTIKYSGTRAEAQGDNWSNFYDVSCYPKEILWNDRSQQPRWKVVFNRTAGRLDPPNSPVKMYETDVLNSIDMFVNSSDPYADIPANWQRIRRYQLNQHWIVVAGDARFGATRQHLVLDSVQEFGSDNTTTLPAWTFTYENLFLRYLMDGQTQVGLHEMPFLKEVANGHGGRIVFTYESVASYADDDEGIDRSQWQCVASRTVYDGRTDPAGAPLYQKQSFVGTNALLSFAENDYVPEFRGFNVVTVTDALNANIEQKHRFFQGAVDTTTRYRSDGSSVTDTEGLVGLEYEVQWLDASTELRRQWTDYHKVAWAGAPLQDLPQGVRPDNTIYFSAPEDARLYQGAGSSRKVVTYEDTHGNWTEMKEYASATDANWYRRQTQEFASTPNTNDWILEKSRRVRTYAYGTGSGVLKASTDYYYDNNGRLPGGNPGVPAEYGTDWSVQKPANLRAVRRWRDDNGTRKYYDVFYDYDAYGNKVKETVARDWGSDTVWGASLIATQWRDENEALGYDRLFRAFPKHVDNALSHRTTYVYDPKWGVPTSVTDPNSQVTAYGYDALGRKIAEWLPGDSQGQPGAATITYRYHVGGSLPFSVQIGRRKDMGGGSFGRRQYEWRIYDGSGRLIQTQVDFDRSSQLIRAVDVNEIRTKCDSYGSSPGFNPVTAGQDRIQASHYTQLRSSIQTLWNNASLGTLPNWSSGLAPGAGTTPVFGSDIADLRRWLNLYESKQNLALTNPANTAGTVIVVNRFYSNRGLLEKESVPHLRTPKVPGQFDSADWNASAWPGTSHTYDALERPLTRTRPDGTSVFTWSYSGWSTTAIDENRHKKVFTDDALGRLVKVEEFSGTDPYNRVGTTSYTYDVADRLTNVFDATCHDSNGNLLLPPVGNNTSIQYDQLGRKTSMFEPDTGQWYYVYYADGTLSQQTDARGQTLTFEYDALKRLRYRKNGGATLAEFVYDEVSGGFAGYSGKGRRTTMKFPSTSNRVEAYYDGRGRVVKFKVVLDNVAYDVLSTYDDADRVATITYPNGEVITYRYGDHGLPVGLESNTQGKIVDSVSYNALGKPFDLVLGNGLTTQ